MSVLIQTDNNYGSIVNTMTAMMTTDIGFGKCCNAACVRDSLLRDRTGIDPIFGISETGFYWDSGFWIPDDLVSKILVDKYQIPNPDPGSKKNRNPCPIPQSQFSRRIFNKYIKLVNLFF